MKMPVFRTVLLTLFVITQVAQSASMKRYVEDRFGFEFSYPDIYGVATSPCELAQWAAGQGLQSLYYLSTGAGQNHSSIYVALDRRRFSLKTLERYAHTGQIAAERIQVRDHTFYYFGPGGGGVTYPDLYLYNLNGNILLIQFDGPYPPGSKTPSEQTKQVEKEVLQSFRLIGNGGSQVNW